jgi:hypothetical protein
MDKAQKLSNPESNNTESSELLRTGSIQKYTA